MNVFDFPSQKRPSLLRQVEIARAGRAGARPPVDPNARFAHDVQRGRDHHDQGIAFVEDGLAIIRDALAPNRATVSSRDST